MERREQYVIKFFASSIYLLLMKTQSELYTRVYEWKFWTSSRQFSKTGRLLNEKRSKRNTPRGLTRQLNPTNTKR